MTPLALSLCKTSRAHPDSRQRCEECATLQQAADQRIAPVQSEHDRDASHRQRHTACDRTVRSDAGDRPAHEARQRGHAQRRTDAKQQQIDEASPHRRDRRHDQRGERATARQTRGPRPQAAVAGRASIGRRTQLLTALRARGNASGPPTPGRPTGRSRGSRTPPAAARRRTRGRPRRSLACQRARRPGACRPPAASACDRSPSTRRATRLSERCARRSTGSTARRDDRARAHVAYRAACPGRHWRRTAPAVR